MQNQRDDEINKLKINIKNVEKDIKDIEEDLLAPDHVVAEQERL